MNPKERIGQKINNLTILNVFQNVNDKKWWAKCVCDCGNIRLTPMYSVLYGHCKSCGCESEHAKLGPDKMIGRTFGQLEVIEYVGKSRNGQKHRWKCKCSCGHFIETDTDSLIRERTTHCRHCRWGSESKNVRMERHLLRRYVNAARKRNIQFSLTDDQFYAIISNPCYFCGKYRNTRNPATKEQHLTYNGVDRLDNSKGYTTENSVPCCSYCNQAKNTRSADEFVQWTKDLYEYQKGK